MAELLMSIIQIEESGILNTGALKSLSVLAIELEDMFNSVQVHRTRTEMEVSVLNDLKYPTPASKYWQSVREQNAMAQGIVMLSFDYRTEKIKIKILEKRISEEYDDLKKELLEIKLERKLYMLKDMQRVARARIREIKDWSEIKHREAKDMSIEELTDVGNHQLISYTKRWINQTIEMGSNGSPSEKHNLLGQLRSGIKLCIERDLIHKVLEGYDTRVKDLILLEYGVK